MSEAINSLNYGDNTYTFTLPYGVCSTAADTAAKTVTVDNFSLEAGAVVIVKFTNANSIASPTLNVNGTGAKSIMRYGTTTTSTGTTTTGWVAGAVQMFTYDGTNWIRDYWNNTTYSNASLGCGYATCDTAAATAAKVGSLSSYSLTTGGIVSVKFTYNVPANATLNINSKGAKNIYYRGAKITADVIKAGDIATFVYSSQYHLIAIDRWQQDIASKQATITGAATTITSDNLTASRALVSDANGKVAVSAVTSTELGYLDGVTSNVQTQLDGKSSTDTKNTAGSTNSSSKLFLIGATSQAANPQTYSHDTAYIGTDGYLYSNSEKVYPRIYTTLIPYGTAIAANSDLNTINFLKVGNYCCSSNATVKTLKNCPLTVYGSDGAGTSGAAFMMQVYSPLSPDFDDETTGTWRYRIRKIIHYNTGIEYTQYCYVGGTAGASNWSYGDWFVNPRSKFTFNKTSSSTAAIGSATKPVYVDSTGTITACTYTLGKSVPSDAKFTDTDTKVTQNAAITTSGAYPVLLGYSTDTTAVTNTVNKTNSVTVDPASGALQAKILNLAAGIEIVPDSSSNVGGRIDFHYNGSSADYTSRIIENASGVVDVLGTSLKVNGNKVLTSSNVTAIYNTSVTFTSGVATYTNSAIKSSSICFVQRRAASAGNNLAFTTTSNNGSVTIAAAAVTSGAINVNIIIINP